jgi:hypothetical protein
MNSLASWLDDPYFDTPEPESRDGGYTDRGPLWHAVSPRWGHSMHTMCSYQGMFPARLAHFFTQSYTRPGDLVLDPFSGRGTTVLQARVEGRRALGNDLNPLGFVLTRAKARPPRWSRFVNFLDILARAYKPGKQDLASVSDDVSMLFHHETLDQLLFLRGCLLTKPWSKWSDNDFFLAGCVAGVLHGAHRRDGTSGYLSISMPNTFSMSPTYVRKFIKEKRLKPPRVSVFDVVRDKAARLYMDAVGTSTGKAYLRDATSLLNKRELIRSGTVDLLLSSPPYLKVVNYGTANWIRLWWLGTDGVGRQRGKGRLVLDRRLDHQHTYESYKKFMLRTFRGCRRVLRRDGVAVFVIGDVAQPDRPTVDLATSLWNDVGDETGLVLLDVIEDRLQAQNKVSRIWGETRGQATEIDRILILRRKDGKDRNPASVSWEEPYKDGGPDAAHKLASRPSTTS